MNSKIKIVSAKEVINAGKNSTVVFEKNNFWIIFNALKSKVCK